MSGRGLSKDTQIALEENKKGLLDSKILQQISQEYWKTKTAPSLYFSTQLGNIYTGSLYTGLVSLISDPAVDLEVISNSIRFLTFFRTKEF